jgi:hypothetical protein
MIDRVKVLCFDIRSFTGTDKQALLISGAGFITHSVFPEVA